MRHRALFLAILLGLALLLGVTACQQLEQTVQAMQPEVRGVTLEWGEVTPQSAEFTTTLLVYNPSPISLPVKRVTSEIFMDGIPMGSAETLDLRIEKQAEFPIRVSARIDNTKIPAFWAEHIRRQEKSEAQIDTKATFDLGLTDFTFPFRVKRPITTDLLSPLSRMEPIRVEQAVRLPGAGGEAEGIAAGAAHPKRPAPTTNRNRVRFMKSSRRATRIEASIRPPADRDRPT